MRHRSKVDVRRLRRGCGSAAWFVVQADACFAPCPLEVARAEMERAQAARDHALACAMQVAATRSGLGIHTRQARLLVRRGWEAFFPVERSVRQ
jgi:hypothetical protein